jgi:hypothetical protein
LASACDHRERVYESIVEGISITHRMPRHRDVHDVYDVPRNAQYDTRATHRAVHAAAYSDTGRTHEPEPPDTARHRQTRRRPRSTVSRTACTNARIAYRTARAHARCRSHRRGGQKAQRSAAGLACAFIIHRRDRRWVPSLSLSLSFCFCFSLPSTGFS